MTDLSSIEFDFREGVSRLDATQWDRLVGDASPFLEHGFLALLEETGCVGGDTGWIPQILVAEAPSDDGGELVGALPLYLKSHSAGEFVFDWNWADAAQRAGLSYYPKAVVAVPFTPITGQRVLVDRDHDDADAIARELVDRAVSFVDDNDLSSLHFNFVEPEERELFDDFELPIRLGKQYHWYNGADLGDGPDYDDFSDYLARFRSKKRSNIKRERRKLREAGVETEVLVGDDINEAQLDRMYDYYVDTIEKFFWGRRYLNRDFFLGSKDAFGDRIHMVIAKQDGQQYAGAFNLMKGDGLYGRYWGCLREVKYTHFEVCLYRAVDWCIDQGVQTFEPGAQGEHKYDRGFLPTRTYSAHHIRDPRLRRAVGDFIERETMGVEREIEQMRDDSPFAR